MGLNYLQHTENQRSNLVNEDLGRKRLSEDTRHNITGEVETRRHNTTFEAETNRSNVVNEGISKFRAKEDQRHNYAGESLGNRTLSENQRANLEQEEQGRWKIVETKRSNVENELLKRRQNEETNRSNVQHETDSRISNAFKYLGSTAGAVAAVNTMTQDAPSLLSNFDKEVSKFEGGLNAGMKFVDTIFGNLPRSK